MDEIYPGKIRYTYKTDPNSPLRPAHGVWGGVTPHGEIEMSFYDESSDPPLTSEQELNPDGTPGAERVFQEENVRNVTRTIHSRILLNYQNARAILEWLEDRLNELEDNGQGDIYDLGSGIQQ